MLQFMKKKDVEKLIQQTLEITHKFLLKEISKNNVIDYSYMDFEKYVDALNQFKKEQKQ